MENSNFKESKTWTTNEKYHQFLSALRSRWLDVWNNLTIEPAIFLWAFTIYLRGSTSSQLLIYKSCRVDFNASDAVCQNLHDPENKALNDAITDEVAQLQVYQKLVSSLLPAFMQFYIGAWADIFGRQRLMYAYLGASMVESFIKILNSVFILWPKEYTILEDIPVSLIGGTGVWYLCRFSFISDISQPDQRAFRMGMTYAASSVGALIAPVASAAIFDGGNKIRENFGFALVDIVIFTSLIFVILILYLMIRKVKWNPQSEHIENAKKRSVFSPHHVKDSLRAVFRKRPGNNRLFLWLTVAIFLFHITPSFGEGVISYLYTYTRYGWEVDQYSTYSTVSSLIRLLGLVMIVPLFDKFGVNEAYILLGVFTSSLTRNMIKGLASEGWMYYLGAMLDLIGYYTDPVCRAMIAMCVPQEELGKVYALVATVEAIEPLFVNQVYASLFEATKNTVPGAVFFLSCGMIGIAYILTFWVTYLLKGKRLSAVIEKEPDKSFVDKREKGKIQVFEDYNILSVANL